MYTNKLDNLDEMGEFLERCKLLKFTQEKIEDMIIFIKSRDRTNNQNTSHKENPSAQWLHCWIISNV